MWPRCSASPPRTLSITCSGAIEGRGCWAFWSTRCLNACSAWPSCTSPWSPWLTPACFLSKARRPPLPSTCLCPATRAKHQRPQQRPHMWSRLAQLSQLPTTQPWRMLPSPCWWRWLTFCSSCATGGWLPWAASVVWRSCCLWRPARIYANAWWVASYRRI